MRAVKVAPWSTISRLSDTSGQPREVDVIPCTVRSRRNKLAEHPAGAARMHAAWGPTQRAGDVYISVARLRTGKGCLASSTETYKPIVAWGLSEVVALVRCDIRGRWVWGANPYKGWSVGSAVEETT